MLGKIWKRPEVFWNMPFRLVCNQSSTVGTSAANTKVLALHLNSISIYVQRLALMDIQTKNKSMLGRETPMKFQKDADTMDFGIQRLVNC